MIVDNKVYLNIFNNIPQGRAIKVFSNCLLRKCYYFDPKNQGIKLLLDHNNNIQTNNKKNLHSYRTLADAKSY